MEPVVRPLLTVVEKSCHDKGQGRRKGSYTKIGDSNEPMIEMGDFRRS